ncbi:5-methylcytosine-specific restriction endonuclease McrA (McrA) [Fructobacillus evanidus]|uniref:Putative HNH nuclease YajD n=1 Tax=Fructobacillus evanidus TaxID=3064281 RepID=A0ABM9MZY4_9LACO|nr:5-methylcytosine-specific restriction endonuclease McrA (McrA) [Fructobacillus sp. LMG 32999]CAK1251711.1 5-methylcytosine-specific restriction endonuclease McrA (McrA) [Fructobacillus sp. LMG 32999]
MPRVKRCRANGCHAMVAFDSRYCKRHQDLAMDEPKPVRNTYHYNHHTRNRNGQKIDQYKFYRTRQWVQLRQSTLDAQHYLCQYCLADGIVTTAKTIDHRIPIEFDSNLRADINNLDVICSSCHTKKTNWERKWYGTGNGNKLRQVRAIDDVKTINKMMNDV